MIWIRNLLMLMQLLRKIDLKFVLIVFAKRRRRKGRKSIVNLALNKRISIVII